MEVYVKPEKGSLSGNSYGLVFYDEDLVRIVNYIYLSGVTKTLTSIKWEITAPSFINAWLGPVLSNRLGSSPIINEED